jgi:hypothetical protein
MDSSDTLGSEPDTNTTGFVRAQTNNVVDLTGDSDDGCVLLQSAKSKEVISPETEDEGEFEEDEDLKRAIALSLQDVKMSPRSRGPIDFQIGQGASIQSPPRTENSSDAPPFGILGMDRKKEEQERLARLAKRKAEVNISPPRTTKWKNDVSSGPLLGSSPKPLLSQPNRSDCAKKAKTTGRRPRTDATPSTTPGIQFPRGTVKKTWAFLFPRKGDDIKIEEVLQRSNLELALLSAFQWNMEWLFSKVDTSRTRLLLVMQAKDESMVSSPITIHFHPINVLHLALSYFCGELFSLTAIETRVRSRHSCNIQLKAMLPTHGRTSQLHALKTYVAISPQLP